jgi:5'-3' exonuclease
MGIGDWWSAALGSFKEEDYVSISEFAGKTFAVDLSIFLCAYTATDIDKLAQTSTPPYPAPDLLHKIQTIHDSLSQHINLVYVFDGIAPPHKKWKRDERRKRREKDGEAWTSLLQ